ncbi:MAG: hypothetical protein AAF682_17530 [Planctomycetota bacterium]
MSGVREPLELGGGQGFRYAELSPDLLERVPRWLDEGRVDEGEEVRERRVYRWTEGGTDLAIKLFGRAESRRFKDRFLHSPAIRSADLYAKLLPIPSPRPLLALDWRRGGKRRASLLVYEWVEGGFLERLWGRDIAAIGAFPAFLAAMHQRRVFHGDFHLHNMLWSGEAWVLLDLVALRHPLRNLLPARLAVDHWAKVGVGLEHWCGTTDAELLPLFEDYAGRCDLLDADDWSSVLRRWALRREQLRLRRAAEARS